MPHARSPIDDLPRAAALRGALALVTAGILAAGGGCGGGGAAPPTPPAATQAAAPGGAALAEAEEVDVPEPLDVPDPLTEEQVAAMQKQEMLEALAEVSAARRLALEHGDTELRDRLKRDFDLLMAHIKNAPSLPDESGGTGPPPIPEPLTAEQVEAMTRPQALSALAAVTRARSWAESQGDTELAGRLKKDFDLLMARAKRSEGDG